MAEQVDRCSGGLFVLTGDGGLSAATLLTTSVALANSGSLTAQSTQVIELCSSHSSSLHEIDVVDDGGMEREDPFNTNPEARLANGNGFSGAAVLARNDYTFKRLQALLGLRFLNANVNAHGIARLKLGNILSQLGIFDIV
jgi:hypothetical protein